VTLDDRWITDGCVEVHALVEAGDSEGAAELAADLEAHAFGRPPRSCVACGMPAMPGARWCFGHRPCFIPRPLAQPPALFWRRLGQFVAWDRRTWAAA